MKNFEMWKKPIEPTRHVEFTFLREVDYENLFNKTIACLLKDSQSKADSENPNFVSVSLDSFTQALTSCFVEETKHLQEVYIREPSTNPFEYDTSVTFWKKIPEDKKSFQKRLKSYEKMLAKYEQWRAKNEDLIRQHEERECTQKAIASLEKEIKRAQGSRRSLKSAQAGAISEDIKKSLDQAIEATDKKIEELEAKLAELKSEVKIND